MPSSACKNKSEKGFLKSKEDLGYKISIATFVLLLISAAAFCNQQNRQIEATLFGLAAVFLALTTHLLIKNEPKI